MNCTNCGSLLDNIHNGENQYICQRCGATYVAEFKRIVSLHRTDKKFVSITTSSSTSGDVKYLNGYIYANKN